MERQVIEKRCSNCGLGRDIQVQASKEAITVVVVHGQVLEHAQTTEQAYGFVIRRLCSEGGETVKDFDKCRIRREFQPRPQV